WATPSEKALSPVHVKIENAPASTISWMPALAAIEFEKRRPFPLAEYLHKLHHGLVDTPWCRLQIAHRIHMPAHRKRFRRLLVAAMPQERLTILIVKPCPGLGLFQCRPKYLGHVRQRQFLCRRRFRIGNLRLAPFPLDDDPGQCLQAAVESPIPHPQALA